MKIGTEAPAIILKNINEKEFSLTQIYDNILVIIFTCNHCPYAQAYDSRIKALAEDYKGKAQFILINSNDGKKFPEDNFQAMQEAHRNKGFTFPYLHDETQAIAKAYGAECTPHTFVFNKKKLIYEGAIDDNWKEADLAMESYLQDAIEAGLENEKPTKEKVEPKGCSIKWR